MFTDKMAEVDNIIADNVGIPIIVEGKKDRKVLSYLGFSGIREIAGRTLTEVVDGLVSEHCSSVIILTDFDETGRRKFLELSNLFHKYHILTRDSVRKRIRSLFNIVKIEELSHITRFMNFIGDDYYGKTSPIYNKIFNRGRIRGRWNSRETGRHWGNIRPD